MRNRGTIWVVLLLGVTTFGIAENNITQEANLSEVKNTMEIEPSSLDAMEDQIQKALMGITVFKVLKEGESKIISESEAMVLDKDKVKVIKKVKRKKYKKRIVHKKKSVNMDDLPMAKTYSMDYDLSLIKE